MRRWTIRWRVVAAATAVAAAGLAGASWLLVETTERALLHGARSDAETVAAEVAATLARAGPHGPVSLELAPGTSFVVRDGAGTVVASSASGPGGGAVISVAPRGQDDPAPLAGRPRFVDAATVVGLGDDRYTVTAAVSTEALLRSLRTLRSVLWLGVPGLVAAIGLLVWWLAGRALAPVARLTEQACRIAGPGGGERLPVPDADDEVSDLARTLNGMLDRLDASAARSARFVSDASHELRSPITTIRALVESAGRGGAAADWPATGREVLAESERLERLVGDLLTLARHNEGPAPAHRPVDLRAMVSEEAARRRRVPVEVGAGRPAVVSGSRERLAQLVRHLVDNAARHARARVMVDVEAANGVTVLRVRDDGPGVPPGDRDRIFDRFARLDEARSRDAGGFGLGLAVARAVAEEHGATIAVADAPGGGACFTVRFDGVATAASVNGSRPARAGRP